MSDRATNMGSPHPARWAEVGALIAILISLTSCGANAYYHLRGPIVEVFPAEQVRLFGYRNEEGEPSNVGVIVGLEFMNSSPLVAGLTKSQSIRIMSGGSTMACLDSRAVVSYQNQADTAETLRAGSRSVFLLSGSTKTELPPGKFTERRMLFDQQAASSDANPCFSSQRQAKLTIKDLVAAAESKKISLQIKIDMLRDPDIALSCDVSFSAAAARRLIEAGEIVLPCFSAVATKDSDPAKDPSTNTRRTRGLTTGTRASTRD